jgi:DNA repair ATPase RecN
MIAFDVTACAESPTVATLTVRGQFAPLRRLLSRLPVPPDDRHDLDAALDELVYAFTESLLAFEGFVPKEDAEALEEQVKDLRAEANDETTRREDAEQKLENLLQAATDSPEELTSKLALAADREKGLQEQIERLKAKVVHADERVTAYAKDASEAAREVTAVRARMAVWLEDRTAAETADHYREKYDAKCREHADFFNGVRRALTDARKVAGRSKVKTAFLSTIEGAIMAVRP